MTGRSKHRHPGLTRVESIIVISIIIILLALILTGISKFRQASRRASTQCKLNALGLAFNNFDGAYGLLPHNQGEVKGGNTRPALYHLLPYMENETYYNLNLENNEHPAVLTSFKSKHRAGIDLLRDGSVTDFATNGAIFGDISTDETTITLAVGNPTTLTIPGRHEKVKNCSVLSIASITKSRQGTSYVIFAGQKRMSQGNYDQRSGDMGICRTATTTMPSSGGGGRGTPHAITGCFVDSDPAGNALLYGDWGGAEPGGTTFLFGDGHTATLRNTLSMTAAFADAMNPKSTASGGVE